MQVDVAPRPIRFHTCVNAAGPWAGDVARMAGIRPDSDNAMLRIPVPIERRCVEIDERLFRLH